MKKIAKCMLIIVFVALNVGVAFDAVGGLQICKCYKSGLNCEVAECEFGSFSGTCGDTNAECPGGEELDCINDPDAKDCPPPIE